MSINNYSIITRELMEAEIAISGIESNDEISELLVLVGLTQDKIQAGRLLLTQAEELNHLHKKEYGEKYDATEQLHTIWKELKGYYNHLIAIGRIAFRNDVQAQTELQLTGSRKKNVVAYQEQAEITYGNILRSPEYKTRITGFGYTEERLTNEYNKVLELKEAIVSQQKETAEAIDSTRVRDEKLEELQDWMYELRELAKVALAAHPVYLETLGF